METRNADCVATRLTPHGRGAVAVIVVEGIDAIEYVARHFVAAGGRPPLSFPLNRILFGCWQPPDGSREEIVVCRTGESSLELNCHGGIAAARAIINAFVADGAVEQSPEMWVTSHSRDAIEAETRLALSKAHTERTAAILLDQFRGALRRAIESAIDELKRGERAAAKRRLEWLLGRSSIGLHVTKPWRVAFAGPPNVGKSSLMNCLLGYQRSIVFDKPGTTRDLLSASTAFDGWPIELIDTAGLRESRDLIEAEGVSRATNLLADADLTVLVFDVTRDWSTEREQIRAKTPNALQVINKCDLPSTSYADAEALATSALTGRGVSELMQQIVKRLVPCKFVPGDPVPFTHRQSQAIDLARRAIADGAISDAITALKMLISGDEGSTSD